jgi:hypothetical protein
MPWLIRIRRPSRGRDDARGQCTISMAPLRSTRRDRLVSVALAILAMTSARAQLSGEASRDPSDLSQLRRIRRQICRTVRNRRHPWSRRRVHRLIR